MRIFNASSQCLGKRKYDSKQSAKYAAKDSKRRFGGRWQCYECWHCDGYHVGHKPKIKEKQYEPPSSIEA